jgi:hypothetical protein
MKLTHPRRGPAHRGEHSQAVGTVAQDLSGLAVMRPLGKGDRKA